MPASLSNMPTITQLRENQESHLYLSDFESRALTTKCFLWLQSEGLPKWREVSSRLATAWNRFLQIPMTLSISSDCGSCSFQTASLWQNNQVVSTDVLLINAIFFEKKKRTRNKITTKSKHISYNNKYVAYTIILQNTDLAWGKVIT